MAGRDVVVVGASAGGVEALMGLVRALPADLPAAVFVVLHVPPTGTSLLPEILSRRGPLPARHPADGEAFRPGQIYVAPPDRHLLVQRGRVCLTRGPRENRARPAVDPLFRSAARAYGPRAVGVVLSGTLDDGTAGLLAVRSRGGVGIAQDPTEALFPSMPLSCIEHGAVDLTLPVADIAATLAHLAREDVAAGDLGPVPRDLDLEVEMAETDAGTAAHDVHPGQPSALACPDCGGVLWELQDGGPLRFRCRVGHAYSTDSLLAQQTEALEDALWAALRGLEEQAALARRLVERADGRRQPTVAARFAEQERAAAERAAVVQRALGISEVPSDGVLAMPGAIGSNGGPTAATA